MELRCNSLFLLDVKIISLTINQYVTNYCPVQRLFLARSRNANHYVTELIEP